MAVHEHKAKATRAVRCLVITVSDTRTECNDESGQLIKELLAQRGHETVGYRIVKDEPDEIGALLQETLVRDDMEAVLLSGGTGIAPRDGTYEIVSQLLEKRLDGFGELFRFLSYQEIGSAAIMSRAVAGVASGKVVISLPGSKGAVRLAMEQLVLPELGHMISLVQDR